MKVLVVKRVRCVPSDRGLYRRLWRDPELRELCDIEGFEKPYHPSQLTRFRQRIGPESLKRLYAYKASAERTISRLKLHLSLEKPQRV
ncbi:transposase [Candidatus Bathyarchaeota archaeon]|nr:transposase [Candidatus Bathyarchaeota archaeon]